MTVRYLSFCSSNEAISYSSLQVVESIKNCRDSGGALGTRRPPPLQRLRNSINGTPENDVRNDCKRNSHEQTLERTKSSKDDDLVADVKDHGEHKNFLDRFPGVT